MLGRSFFLQVLVVALFGLTLFAFLASLASNAIGEDEFNEGLFMRSSALADMLIPPADAPVSEQVAAITEVAKRLELELTLYAANGELISASASPAEWFEPTRGAGEWEAFDNQRSWQTQLADGRVLVLVLDRLPSLGDTAALTVTFILLAVIIAGLLYPLARRVTRRLERLESEVSAFGPENLSSRVTVEGKDEIAKLAMSFNRSTDLIEDLISRQRLLLANTSHELRTPLARLRLGVELIETKNTPERREDLRKDIRELDALIDDLISMVRFDAGGIRDGFSEVDLFEVVNEEARLIGGIDVRGGSAIVRGDPRMLKHLARNLLNNAKMHGAAPYSVTTGQDGAATFLSVSDSGGGIPKEEQKQVFEPFYRGKNKQNKDGYGLGLPLVARIAKAHGAAIRIENEPVFTILVLFSDAAHCAERSR